MNTQRPKPLRCATVILLSLICATVLVEIDSATPWPPLSRDGLISWWERRGTATASMTLFRMAGIALSGWGIFIGTAGWIAAVSPSAVLHGVWRRITPTSVRRMLAVSVVSVAITVPAVAAATTQSPEIQVEMVDLGEHVEPRFTSPVLSDLGPHVTEASHAPSVDAAWHAESGLSASRAESVDAASHAESVDAASHAESGLSASRLGERRTARSPERCECGGRLKTLDGDQRRPPVEDRHAGTARARQPG